MGYVDKLGSRWYNGIMKETDYLVGGRPGDFAPIMPTQQVHIIAGPSGSGKTTLLFQLVKAIHAGEPFLGYPTAKHPMVYVTYDRSVEETETTMSRIGISPDLLPIMSMPVRRPTGETDARFEDDMRKVRNAHPNASILFIDGFYALIPHGRINDFLTVAEFLQRVRQYCVDNNITVVGVAHSPKQREGQRITDPRQMILGSVAGAGFTSCGLVLLQESGNNANVIQNRELYVLPRNAPEQKMLLGLSANGLFAESYVVSDGSRGGRPRSSNHAKFIEILWSLVSPGETFTIGDLLKHGFDQGLSRGSINQWLSEMVTEGSVQRIKHGLYTLAPGASGDAPEPPTASEGGANA